MVLGSWQVGEVLWTFIWFTFIFIWIWLAISVFIDIFRSHDLSGVAKAIWILFIIVVPLIAILIYLIVRGDKMRVHAVEAAKAQDEAAQEYIRQAAGTASSPADELHRLADLKDRGVIDQAEFDRLKAKVIAD
jgi:type VI protein secretion system component VasK